MRWLIILIWLTTIVALPLCGSFVFGRYDTRLLTLPPHLSGIPHHQFSWWAFGTLAVLVTVLIAPFIVRGIRARKSGLSPKPVYAIPRWRFLGFGMVGICWIIAWSRFETLKDFQLHTFAPLWLSYVFLMNILVYERTGTAPALQYGHKFFALFPLSAAMWWSFEWLNRFVENWRYEEVNTFSAGMYALLASSAFVTVLPAVLVTKKYIASFSFIHGTYSNWTCVDFTAKQRALGAFIGAAALFVLPIWSEFIFPLIWIAPLLLLVALCTGKNEPMLLKQLRIGNWIPFVDWSLAGLWCGALWELWNFRSLARWVYDIPYVDRFRIFEMPLLGYAGYIPFGLLCGILCDMIVVEKPISTARNVLSSDDADILF